MRKNTLRKLKTSLKTSKSGFYYKAYLEILQDRLFLFAKIRYNIYIMKMNFNLHLDGYPKESPSRCKSKPIIICGDFNVAATEIDLKNPKSNRRNAGFTDEERGKFQELLEAGFTDAFRKLYPDKEGAYTWWSYRFNARKNNAGWRIDYFIVSNDIADRIRDVIIHDEIMGSDHCPIELDIDL